MHEKSLVSRMANQDTQRETDIANKRERNLMFTKVVTFQQIFLV